jgi:hypothetical protein
MIRSFAENLRGSEQTQMEKIHEQRNSYCYRFWWTVQSAGGKARQGM